jgi:DNA-binding NarL/FixJ family response regulator
VSVTIILVDDHKIVREGLRTLLEKQPGFRVVAEAAGGAAAVRLARQLSPDVVIMDVTLPDLNGVEATRQIVARDPAVKVIALSMHSDRRFVVEMLRGGAKGYLLKDSAFDELATAIHAVVANRTYLSAQITDTIVKEFLIHGSGEGPSAYTVLTPRERQVLQLLAEGGSTKEIAAQMGVSAKTIETHRKQLMDKVGVRSIAELTKYAIREGLTTL